MKSRTLIIILLVVVLLLGMYFFFKRQNKAVKSLPEITHAIGQRSKNSGCAVQGPHPDPVCTPGAVFPDATKEEICTPGYSKRVRNVPVAVKREVYREYGIAHRDPGEYEVDHLIPLELGGSNDFANLFPQAAEPKPGCHEKDRVENYLHKEVCAGRIPLQEAQYEIASNWLGIYKKISGR